MSPRESKQLKRIREVTANYFFWQGLRWVPVGIVIVMLGLRRSLWRPPSGIWHDVSLFAAVAAAIVISPLIGGYYRRTFGAVCGEPGAHRRRELMKWAVVYPAMFGSLVIDLAYKPAFFVSGPVWAGGILAYWWSTGRGRHHYLIAALCMGALGFVGWLGLVEPGKQMFSVFALVLGAIYICGGLLDHLELRQLLRPVKEPQDEAPV